MKEYASGNTTIKHLPPADTAQYSTSGFTAIARFEGRVHGVVVQITISASLRPRRLFDSSSSLKATHMEVLVCSAYSISAYARALAHGIDQYTGFLLL